MFTVNFFCILKQIQWGKKVFSQPPIVQVLPLKKMREACNFHHRYTCHESGCHSPQLHITLGLHLPSCTAHTHSRPPLHQSHSCHHSLINPDCLTTPAPHSLTHIKAAHKHSPSAKSCFLLATFPSGFPSLSSRVLPGLLTPSPDRLLPASLTPPAFW